MPLKVKLMIFPWCSKSEATRGHKWPISILHFLSITESESSDYCLRLQRFDELATSHQWHDSSPHTKSCCQSIEDIAARKPIQIVSFQLRVQAAGHGESVRLQEWSLHSPLWIGSQYIIS